ncbi:MAG: S41 family peptidase [Defluviitaleaceae bacterium]|nr:S41 family peptidase [Defluviitaleaceae bacterium]
MKRVGDEQVNEENQVYERLPRKKISWLTVLSISILTFTAGIVATYLFFEWEQATIVRNLEGESFDDFLRVLGELQNNHYFFDEDVDLIRGAIDGMIASTGDAYTNFFTVLDFEDAMGHLRESFYGIGAEVATIGGDVVIVTPMPGSPAEHYGVLAGDVVLSVDGEDVRDENLREVIDRIRGEYGTVVTLGILRAGTQLIDIDVTRGRIVNETVTTEVFEANGERIGLISVSTFGETTLRDFRDAIEALEEVGIEGLIVDMRNNAGGYLNAVNGMVSYLLPSGLVITSAVDRDGNETVHLTRGGAEHRLDVDIVTLINGGSASASEIFAAAMIESGGFEVIGTTSFGKGTVQQSRSIGEDGILQLTIQAWLTPDGHLIEGHGVVPTQYVEPAEFLSISQVHLGDETLLTYDQVHSGVSSAQMILELLGYPINRTDGYFDALTVESVREFQADKDLEATGDIDRLTASALSVALRDKARNPTYDVQLQAALEWLSRE